MLFRLLSVISLSTTFVFSVVHTNEVLSVPKNNAPTQINGLVDYHLLVEHQTDFTQYDSFVVAVPLRVQMNNEENVEVVYDDRDYQSAMYYSGYSVFDTSSYLSTYSWSNPLSLCADFGSFLSGVVGPIQNDIVLYYGFINNNETILMYRFATYGNSISNIGYYEQYVSNYYFVVSSDFTGVQYKNYNICNSPFEVDTLSVNALDFISSKVSGYNLGDFVNFEYIPFDFYTRIFDYDSITLNVNYNMCLDSDSLAYESYNQGYKNGYNDGYNDGSSTGYNSGYEDGYGVGHTDGYREGVNTQPLQLNFLTLLGAIADTPVYMIRSLFSFEFFGISALAVFMTLLTALVVIYFVRKLL